MFDCLRRNLVESRRHDFPLGMVELGNGIMDAHKLRRIAQGVPDHIEPVRVTELGGFVPLVGGQADRLAARAALNLDAPQSRHGVAVARLRVGWAEAPQVEAELEVPDALALPAP